MPEPAQPAADRLDSWKEIAYYLDREVRTVQGWEKNEGLPVHRHQHARQGTVYAFKSELDAWKKQRTLVPEAPLVAATNPESPQRVNPWRNGLIAGVCAIVLIAVATFAWNRINTANAAPSSLAVLPFVDMSPAKDQEYFSDGLTEEIIDAMSRVPKMRVVARTSVFEFKGKATDIREIGRRLNVTAVLEGSVRKSGDQVRITAQLNRTSDGFHLWSRTYDRPMSDIFSLQREISQSIANQLGGGQISRHEPTTDLEAYRLYQEGRYFFNQFNLGDSNIKAVEHFQQAIQRDPKFALAYAGMADAYAYQAENFMAATKDVMPKAKAAAEKAVALDPTLGAGHTSLGIVKLDYEWDVAGADRELRKAIELSPSSGYANHWLGHAFEAELRLDDAIEQFRSSIPLDPLSLPAYWDLAGDLAIAKRFDEARSLLHKARGLFPENPLFPASEMALEIRMGNPAGARRARDGWKIPEWMLNNPQLIGGDGILAAKEGKPEEARRALARLEEMRKTQFVDDLSVLELCHALEDRKCVMTWLTRAYENRSVVFPYVRLYFAESIAGIPEAEALVDRALGRVK